MPGTNKTIHGLNLWVEDDTPAMEDFNSDNQTIDTLIEDIQTDIDNNRKDIAAAIAAGVLNRPFRLEAEAWADSTEFITHPFEAVIPVEGILPDDDVLLLFDLCSVAAAQDAGLSGGIGETVTEGIRVFAEQRPAVALTGSLSIIHRQK